MGSLPSSNNHNLLKEGMQNILATYVHICLLLEKNGQIFINQPTF